MPAAWLWRQDADHSGGPPGSQRRPVPQPALPDLRLRVQNAGAGRRWCTSTEDSCWRQNHPATTL